MAALLLFGLCRTVPGQDLPLDRAFQDYWAAVTADEIARAAEAIAATDADFDAVRSRLEAGRPYRGDVPTGRHLLTRRNRDGTEHDYVVLIPGSYDPARRYPVRVYLHGGVARAKQRDGRWWPNDEALGRVDSIAVFPASWEGSIWWQASQVENLRGVLNDLKRTYNLDDNRASLLGVSDGATGVYYHGFKATTPWASFLPFNGHPVVLGNPTSGVDGEMYVPNLTNKSFFVVNGVFDRLYPAESVARYMRLFVEAGVDLDFRPQNSGHDMTWWPREVASIDVFMQSTARDPLPDRLTWETERTDRFNRAHWLLISELGSVEGESDLEAFNTITPDVPLPPLGISMLGELTNGRGVVALDVAPNTVAYDAGMRAGDLILEVNGIETVDVSTFRPALGRIGPGSTIPIVIEREGARHALTLAFPAGPGVESYEAFPRRLPTGRVEVARDENTVTARTQGVRRYTLLLSPDDFDFSQPVTVTTNGIVSFQGSVIPDVDVLLRWAATDQDRTMLFGAELEIEVEPIRP